MAIVSVVGMVAISGCKKKETYIVTFNSNGGTGTMAAQIFTEGEAQALTRNAFTYDCYTFIGWNTVHDGTGTTYTDGETITVTADMILYAQWEKTRGQLNGHDWVDLGLPSGLLWATCNVGATNPEGYGNYYAWGEITTKITYKGSTYTYTGNPTTLPSRADAATANWGTGWRMPTYDEMVELKNNCTVTWTTKNGVNGRLFTGPNGNSVFLPAAGFYYERGLDSAGSYGRYWSSSLYTGSTGDAWFIYFYSGNYDMFHNYRYLGQPVRPVCAQ